MGQVSQILAWAAATAYTVAFIAYSLDLARRSSTRAQARAETREKVLAGGGQSEQAALPGSPATPGTSSREQVGSRKGVGIGWSTLVLGSLFHLGSVITRGIAAGRLPWANMYEFTLVGSFVAVAVFILFARRFRMIYLGAPLAGLSVLAIGLAEVVFYTAPDGLQPALQSYWLAIHVTVAVAATGVFCIGFLLAVLQLLKDYRQAGTAWLGSRRWGFLDSLPSIATLERRSFEFNAVAFVLWTFTVIAGAIWAEHAWGRYWGWDPKEVWSFVIWIVYAAYLHARTTRGWSGRASGYLVVVGFACLIFNFTGVNYLFVGKHSYAELPG